MEFILASSNEHKAEELNELLNISGTTIQPSKRKIDVVEDGSTFQENALKKAQAYYNEFKNPTVADDSGLVIPARTDILGIYSARYAPEHESYTDKNQALIKDISELSGEERNAYFACYLCFYISPEEIYFFEGRVHGVIASELKGDGGFGYDPIFLPEGQSGKSLAELSEWKMTNSHRAKACKAAVKFFQGQN